jgi:type I site-specific restriction-modification system R (restriction) subunit
VTIRAYRVLARIAESDNLASRQRFRILTILDAKSRESPAIEVDRALIRLRPEWHSDDDASGALKVVMTGSATDPLDWQPHIRNKKGRDDIAKRFKNPANPLKLVIVRDMWLTGLTRCLCEHQCALVHVFERSFAL